MRRMWVADDQVIADRRRGDSNLRVMGEHCTTRRRSTLVILLVQYLSTAGKADTIRTGVGTGLVGTWTNRVINEWYIDVCAPS